jgi:penicillin-binding protein 1A
MRSNYWGQGGHNALRIVGAFMREGQKAKLIDAKAEFPQVVRDAPEAPVAVPEVAPAEASLGAGLARLFGFPAAASRSPVTADEAAADRRLRDMAIGR